MLYICIEYIIKIDMYSITKKLFIVILLTVLTIGIKAQPYKLFIPNVDYLYSDSANYFKGFRIIKTIAEGNGDSIYYPIVETNMYVDNSGCIKSKKYSWISHKIISKPDGTTFLFNFNDDSILFNTQAELNDSWTCFRFKNGNKIIAKITTLDTISFLGILDSVKTITFELYDSINNKQPYLLDTLTIQLSKNYGLIKTVNFFCFPDILLNNGDNYYYRTFLGIFRIAGIKTMGTYNLTKSKVYDFQPGDQMDIYYFHEGSEYQNVSQLDTTRTKRTILERQENNDTIRYKIHEIAQIIQTGWHLYKKTQVDTINWIAYNLNDTLFDVLPSNELFFNSNRSFIYKTLQSNYDNKRLVKLLYKDIGIPYEGNDSCYSFGLLDGCPFYDYYVEGLGGPYYSGTCFDGIYQQRLVYFKKGSETWGTPLSINQRENIEEKTDINIYPNPWSSHSSIYINTTSEGNVLVYDYLGKKVSSMPYQTGNAVINLERINYKPGMYFFLVVPKSGNPVAKKFVVE